MTVFFRSKSCDTVENEFGTTPVHYPSENNYDGEEERWEGEEDDDEEDDEWGDESFKSPDAMPFISPEERSDQNQNNNNGSGGGQYLVLTVLVSVLRKSLVTCSVESDNLDAPEISYPTNVKHVSHVTFDRFNGFLGLPAEL